MLTSQFTLPAWLDLGATFVFAVSGAVRAMRKGYDIVGTFALAFAAALGGVLMRDGLFLQQGPPVIATDNRYLLMVALAVGASIVAGRFVTRIPVTVAVTDALGLGVYAVVGMQKSIAAGLALLPVVLVGVVNAVGGGLLRDVLSREEPFLFKPGQFYAATVVAGCAVFLLLAIGLALDARIAAVASIAVTFSLRLLSIRLDWRTRPLGTTEEGRQDQ